VRVAGTDNVSRVTEWYEQLLEQQLELNRDIWAGLREHGLAFLSEETDYEVSARVRPGSEDAAADVDREWVVIGTTQPTPVSLELLDDWCEWMIAAGAARGPCAFDGWAAQLVDGD